MNALTRRLQKIEQQVAPIKEKDVAILFEPTEGSSAEEWQQHQDELARAQRESDKVLVVSFRKSRREEGRGNVTYVPTEMDATAEALANKPSAIGFDSLLDEAMDRLAGNVIGPVR